MWHYDQDWTDWNMLLDNLNHLHPETAALFRTTKRRVEGIPEKFDREGQNYKEQASMLLLSNFKRKVSFGLCGSGKYPCDLWKFCPACCHKKRKNLLHTFLDGFGKGAWHFLTVSYPPATVIDRDDDGWFQPYWAAPRFAVNLLKKLGKINGAIALEEVAFHSFLGGVHLTPHCHFLIDADSFTMSEVNYLMDMVRCYRGAEFFRESFADYPGEVIDRPLRIGIYDKCHPPPDPTTRTVPVENLRQFGRVLRYHCKSIDLVSPYQRDIQALEDGAEGHFFELNMNVNNALFVLGRESYKRHQRTVCGTCHPASKGIKSFVGVRKKEREKPHFKDRMKYTLTELALESMLIEEELPIPLELRGLEEEEE
jgi:hypothetical protein